MIRLTNIYFSYLTDAGTIPVFKNFNFLIGPGDRVGMTGPNGSGKTTLLRLIMGLIKLEPGQESGQEPGLESGQETANCGEIKIFGKNCLKEADFEKIRRRIGFVFQDADDQLFCPTVEEDIAFGPLNLGFSSKQAREIVREVLATIGLPDYGPRITYNLSGGEKKLVSLGTALAMRPELLILDEPTAGLDEHAEARLVHILNDLALPCLIVSHDKEFLAAVTGRQITLAPCIA